MATVKNRVNRIAADQKLIAGVQQHMATFASLSVDGHVMTPADIVARLQSRVDAVKAVENAEAALKAAQKAERDGRGQSSTFRSALLRLILGMFFSSPNTLAVFGLSAPKVGTMTTEQKAEAVRKNKATREARHTLGPKAKLEIKGAPQAAPATPATPKA